MTQLHFDILGGLLFIVMIAIPLLRNAAFRRGLRQGLQLRAHESRSLRGHMQLQETNWLFTMDEASPGQLSVTGMLTFHQHEHRISAEGYDDQHCSYSLEGITHHRDLTGVWIETAAKGDLRIGTVSLQLSADATELRGVKTIAEGTMLSLSPLTLRHISEGTEFDDHNETTE